LRKAFIRRPENFTGNDGLQGKYQKRGKMTGREGFQKFSKNGEGGFLFDSWGDKK